MSVRARGRMRRVGFTEMFFETQQPENAEVPIPRMLANLPEGTYEFEGVIREAAADHLGEIEERSGGRR